MTRRTDPMREKDETMAPTSRATKAALAAAVLVLGLAGCVPGLRHEPPVSAVDLAQVDPANVVVDTTDQGLIVRAENAYWPSRDWRALLADMGQASPGMVETAFGVPVAMVLHQDVAQMQRRVAEALARRLRYGDLRDTDWGLRTQVRIRVEALSLRFAQDTAVSPLGEGGSERDIVATMAVRASLLDTETGAVVARDDVSASARQSGDTPIKLGYLVRDAVDATYAMLRAAAPTRATPTPATVASPHPAAPALPSTATSPTTVSDVVRRVRAQYGRLRTGDGWAWAERRMARGDGPPRILMRRDYRLVFDETRAQVQFRRVSAFPGQQERTDYGGKYFVDDWRRRDPSDSTTGTAASVGSPPRELLDVLPVHIKGLMPESPLETLEGALRRGQLRLAGAEVRDSLACLVLEGTTYAQGDAMTYDVRLWLAEARGYLPVQTMMTMLGLACVTTFEYDERKAGVWLPVHVLSQLRSGSNVISENELVYEPGFVVNGGTPAALTEAANLIVDEGMWDR